MEEEKKQEEMNGKPEENEEVLDEAASGTEETENGAKEAEEAEDAGELPEEEDGGEDGPDKKEKKSFFERRKEKKNDEKDEKIAALTDRLQRLMAEFDNYRKRTDREKAESLDNGVIKAVEKLLPVVDSFERGLSSATEEELDDALYTGMTNIYKQMLTILSGLGVEQMETVGKTFDPNFHNAVMQTENEELGENVVSQEFQKGYVYKGRVIRPAMVSVNK